MTTAVATGPRIERQGWVALVATTMLLGGTAMLGSGSWRHGVLLLIGAALGLSLYHAAFGFTSAYRNAIAHRDVSGVSAQLVMLALAMLLFAPILADGQLFGRGIGGAVAPVGTRVMVGSFLFGLGMQLGGGCGSGTLYTAGGGSIRMVVTLGAFCAGAFLGSLDAGRWADSWSLGSISLGRALGWGPAIVLQLAVLAVVWLALRGWGHGHPQTPLWGRHWSWRQLLRGPWPMLLSAVLLALLNALTLVVAGHPWTITWAFTLWGAKVATAFGWDPATSPFWSGGFPQAALARGVLQDNTSIMNVGILLGALLGAGMAQRFAPTLRIPLRSLLAAVLGGLVMGYGARMAFGCNIGAFFSGIASFSLHGWVWIAFALIGTWVGMRLRPLFGLAN
jgi:uncharacterized protein